MILVRGVTVFGAHKLVRREDLRLKKTVAAGHHLVGRPGGSLSMVLAMMLVATGDSGEAKRELILNIVFGVVLLFHPCCKAPRSSGS